MNAFCKILGLWTNPIRQKQSTLESDTPKSTFSSALVGFNVFYLRSLALWSFSSEHAALLDYSEPTVVGGEYESDLNGYAFDLTRTEYVALHTSPDNPVVQQQSLQEAMVV